MWPPQLQELCVWDTMNYCQNGYVEFPPWQNLFQPTFCSLSGSDSREVKLIEILEIMDEYPSLRNKPKFLVAQADRGRE